MFKILIIFIFIVFYLKKLLSLMKASKSEFKLNAEEMKEQMSKIESGERDRDLERKLIKTIFRIILSKLVQYVSIVFYLKSFYNGDLKIATVMILIVFAVYFRPFKKNRIFNRNKTSDELIENAKNVIDNKTFLKEQFVFYVANLVYLTYVLVTLYI